MPRLNGKFSEFLVQQRLHQLWTFICTWRVLSSHVSSYPTMTQAAGTNFNTAWKVKVIYQTPVLKIAAHGAHVQGRKQVWGDQRADGP